MTVEILRFLIVPGRRDEFIQRNEEVWNWRTRADLDSFPGEKEAALEARMSDLVRHQTRHTYELEPMTEDRTRTNSKGPVSRYLKHHFRHFNAATVVDAAEGWERHLEDGGKMLVTLAGAMSTAELGISLAEMIRQDKVLLIRGPGGPVQGPFSG